MSILIIMIIISICVISILLAVVVYQLALNNKSTKLLIDFVQVVQNINLDFDKRIKSLEKDSHIHTTIPNLPFGAL